MYYTIFLFFLKKTVLFGNSIIDKVTNCTCHQENTTTLHNWWSTFSKRSSLCGRVSQCTLLRVSCNDFRCTHMCNRVFVCSCVFVCVCVCVVCRCVARTTRAPRSVSQGVQRKDVVRLWRVSRLAQHTGQRLSRRHRGALRCTCAARVHFVLMCLYVGGSVLGVALVLCVQFNAVGEYYEHTTRHHRSHRVGD